jgi:hypothetical protein
MNSELNRVLSFVINDVKSIGWMSLVNGKLGAPT